MKQLKKWETQIEVELLNIKKKKENCKKQKSRQQNMFAAIDEDSVHAN